MGAFMYAQMVKYIACPFFFFYLMHCVVPAMEAGECLELTQGEFPQWITRNLLNWTRWSKLWQTDEGRVPSCSMLLSYKSVLLLPSMVGFLKLKKKRFFFSRNNQCLWSLQFKTSPSWMIWGLLRGVQGQVRPYLYSSQPSIRKCFCFATS